MHVLEPKASRAVGGQSLAWRTQEFEAFVVDYLGGERDEEADGADEDVFHCNVFLCRRWSAWGLWLGMGRSS